MMFKFFNQSINIVLLLLALSEAVLCALFNESFSSRAPDANNSRSMLATSATQRSSHQNPTASTSHFQKITEAPSGASVISDAPLTLPTGKLATTCSSAGVPLETSFCMT